MNLPTSKWVNTDPDAGLPHALLERLAQQVPPGNIEDIWLFPARRTAAGESTVFLVAALETEADNRRVITARYTVTRDRKGTANVREQIDEHGTAPAAAITRIVNGVLHRMDQEGEQPPRTERIERDPERWWALIEQLGGTRPAVPAEPAPEAAPNSQDAPAPPVEPGPEALPAQNSPVPDPAAD